MVSVLWLEQQFQLLLYILPLHWTLITMYGKYHCLKIPDLNGVWSVRGETLSEDDGVIKYNWEAEIDIEQTWEKISINLKPNKAPAKAIRQLLPKNQEPVVAGFFIIVIVILLMHLSFMS